MPVFASSKEEGKSIEKVKSLAPTVFSLTSHCWWKLQKIARI